MSKSLKQVLMLFVLINITGLLACDRTVFPGFGGRFSPEPEYRPGSPVSNNALITSEYLKHLAVRTAAQLEAAKLATEVGTDLKKGS